MRQPETSAIGSLVLTSVSHIKKTTLQSLGVLRRATKLHLARHEDQVLRRRRKPLQQIGKGRVSKP
jgi:hypothetical protein